MAYEIEWSENSVIITLKDTIYLNELHFITERVNSDSRFGKLKYSIYDFRSVDKFISKEYEMMTIVNFDKDSVKWNNQLKIANISENRDILEIAEDYAVHMLETSWDIKNFSNYNEAITWCEE